MADLSTHCMGLQLANPLVVASCGFGKTLKGIRSCAEAGAGAIVLKSLFEEQIRTETAGLEHQSWLSGHAEAFDYVRRMGMALGPKEYLKLIEEAKKAVPIPIIASLNCISAEWWIEYAQQVELAGADALELNASILPSDADRQPDEVEDLYYEILDEVKSRVTIPVALKIGPYFTSLANFSRTLDERGISALVLFNRFYQLDIDVEAMELSSGYQFSSPSELGQTLRWIALLAGRLDCDLVASTGVHDGAGVIKLLLAGASAVQLCSTLYLNGLEQIGRILEEIERWMKQHYFSSLEEFKGTLSQDTSNRPELYERLQYIKAMAGEE